MTDALRLVGGTVYDPANGLDGVVADVCVEGGRIVATVPEPRAASTSRGMVVMPGGVDIHSHVAGASVNAARRLLPEEHAADAEPAPALARRRAAGALGERRHRAHHVHDRLSLRRPRLHHRVRCGGGAAVRADVARRAGRHADRRRRVLRARGQRRLPVAADSHRRPRARPALRRLAVECGRRLRAEGGQSGRRRDVEARAPRPHRPGRSSRLRQPDAACHPRHVMRRCRGAAPAACHPHPLQRPRPGGQRRHDVGDHAGAVRPPRALHAHPVSRLCRRCRRQTDVGRARAGGVHQPAPRGQRRRGPGDVRPGHDADRRRRRRVPALQEQRAEVGQQRHRAGDRVRHRAAHLSREAGGGGAAVGGRARAVPAGGRSLACGALDRSSQRRILHGVPGADAPADGPCLPRRVPEARERHAAAGECARRRAVAGVHAQRDRDRDPGRPGPPARAEAQGSARRRCRRGHHRLHAEPRPVGDVRDPALCHQEWNRGGRGGATATRARRAAGCTSVRLTTARSKRRCAASSSGTPPCRSTTTQSALCATTPCRRRSWSSSRWSLVVGRWCGAYLAISSSAGLRESPRPSLETEKPQSGTAAA